MLHLQNLDESQGLCIFYRSPFPTISLGTNSYHFPRLSRKSGSSGGYLQDLKFKDILVQPRILQNIQNKHTPSP